MQPRALDDATHGRMQDLCAKGDSLCEQREFEQAFGFYRDALNLVPQPVEDWEAATWILTAIGDLHFQAGMPRKAVEALEDAVRCPGGLGNPFIHLRLGESYFELGDQDRAADELARAYMGAGREIFAQEDTKYIEFLGTRMKPPAGQDHL